MIGRNLSSGLNVAESLEVLVKTDVGVKDMRVGRTFYAWPGQKVSAVNMKPRNISFNLHRHDRLTELPGLSVLQCKHVDFSGLP